MVKLTKIGIDLFKSILTQNWNLVSFSVKRTKVFLYYWYDFQRKL